MFPKLLSTDSSQERTAKEGRMFLISFLILSLVAFIAWYHITYQRQNYLLSKIPGPKKLPIFHSSLEFIGKSPIAIFKWLEDKTKIYGPVWHFTVTPFDTGCAVVTDVKVIETLLTSQVLLEKTVDYDLLVPWIGTGLLISSGKKWFQRRKLLTPGFHFKILDRFVKIMNEQSKVFVQQLSKHDGTKVNIFPLVNLFALDTICEAAMGTNIHAQTTDSEYLRAVKLISEIITLRSFDETKRNSFLYQFTNMCKTEINCLKILHEFTDGVIKKRRNEMLSKNNNYIDNLNSNDQEEEESGKRKKALLDILLSSTIDGQPLTNLEIREEVDTFMFAGHDTTTSAISFAIYNIAKYTDIQQKVYEEAIEVIGDDEEISTQKLNNLSYLDLVIRESLRLFSPVPYFGRKISEEITVNGYTFPKGMNIYIGQYLQRYNTGLYSEPEKFNPHRFDTETSYEKFNPFGYVPFSAGPRNCIGQKFATYELRVILSNIVRNFKITLAEGQEELQLVSELVLRPAAGVFVNVEKRK